MKIYILLLILLTNITAVYGNVLNLWLDKPAAPGMNEGLPVGNGMFGGLILGGGSRGCPPQRCTQ